MEYQSTRNRDLIVPPSKAVLDGIAKDGGLYMFKDFPKLSLDLDGLSKLETLELYTEILSALLFDFSKAQMRELVKKAYAGKFETPDLTPLVDVGGDFMLELFRGPTCAFKDVALSMLPHLITASIKKNAVTDEILILTATSGDTGKAAMAGFRDVPGTRIIVFFPENGVSAIQKAQMLTQEGGNVHVCAIRGNFDDAQTGVKEVFRRSETENLLDGTPVRLSSANSINIGLLAPQVVYYFKAYFDLVRRGAILLGDRIDFVVPTGNFGNILAGYIAKGMDLPVGKLVCASNENDVLTEFINTGHYNKKRVFHKTASPSMDILISSNLERLIFLLCGSDANRVKGYMNELNTRGEYHVGADVLDRLSNEFAAYACNDAETFETIREVYHAHGYLMDTHTAVAWRVCQTYKSEHPNHHPCVVLSTASPYKFSGSVLPALGEAAHDDEFKMMRRINEITGVPIPKSLAELQTKKALHDHVVNKDEMLGFVLDIAKKRPKI